MNNKNLEIEAKSTKVATSILPTKKEQAVCILSTVNGFEQWQPKQGKKNQKRPSIEDKRRKH